MLFCEARQRNAPAKTLQQKKHRRLGAFSLYNVEHAPSGHFALFDEY